MTHLLIDGYNLIRQVPQLIGHEKISLETGRNALIRKLVRYKAARGHTITVIFDGQASLSEFGERFKHSGIGVIFSPAGKTADDVIKELVLRDGSRSVVVSSDREIIRHAEQHGAGVINSPDFYEKLILADRGESMALKTEEASPGRAYKRGSTQKKGPSHKLPKKERRNRMKTKGL